ncbi:MAG: TonB-dependent receptor [Muribaculaceae bacterium]|nr:TonB-dependent receptor [Muribaculaceae bacterium]
MALVCLFASLALYAQETVVKGTVVDDQGEPLIGATVMVAKTTNGTSADLDGNFAIKCKPGAKLVISYVGYETQEVPAKDGMKVVLKETANMLQDVEVVAFGVQKKVSQTGAISSIKSEDLTRTPVSSVTNVLSGQLSGVSTVQYSGEPGSDAASIFVRGKATWVDSKPLIQVDGVERDMWDIDPNEIESISVLKDASATAVFGVRGANGVILVTTKRGKEGKAKIDVSLNFSGQSPTKLIEMANSVEYANFYNYMNRSDGGNDVFSEDIIARFINNEEDPVKRYQNSIRFPNMRWTDYIFKKVTLQQQHNVNISGGNKKVKYFISAGFFSQDGIFDQFGNNDYSFDYRYNRFNYRSNLDINVTPTTDVTVNIAGKIDNSSKPRTGQGAEGMIKGIYGASPFSSAGFDEQGRFIKPTTDADYNIEYDENGDPHSVTLPFIGSDPMGYVTNQPGAFHNTANTITTDVILRQKLDVITKNLSFHVKGSYNSGFSQQKTITASAAMVMPKMMPDGTMEFLTTSFKDSPSYSEPGTTTSKWRNWYIEAAFNWNREFGDHNVTALALYNQSKDYYPSTYSDIARGYVGLVGRVTYDYDNRYLAEVNFGYNGSENFAPGKRFGAFPAGSIGWVVSNEKFMEGLQPWLSFLKFRATLGKVGNDKVGGSRFMYLADPYDVNGGATLDRLGKDAGPYAYMFGTGNGGRAVQLGAAELQKNNPDVTWEKAVKQNYAVDIQFFNDRLKTSFDYYKEHRTDILLQNYNTSSILGYSPAMTNYGIVDSWGWELSVGWNDFIGKDFSYYARFNLSYNDNKIILDGQAPQSEEYMKTAGHRIGARSQMLFFGYYEGPETAEKYAAAYPEQFIAYDEDGNPYDLPHVLPAQLKDNKELNPGDPIYVDLNGDGKIDGNDESRDFGKTDDPRFIAGLNLGGSWRGLSLALQFTAAWDVTRSISGAFQQPFYNAAGDGTGGLLKTHLYDSWTVENPNAEYPRPTLSYKSHTYANSTLWEKDASYFRCKSAQLAYDFNMPWMRKLGIRQLQISLSAYNLFTFTKYKWGDPENRASASPSYPLTRTYTAGVKIGF